jgi:uncharacterized protein YbaR (Trm112 family)
MNEDLLEQISCPKCGQLIDVPEQEQTATCTSCGGHFTLAGHLCHRCHTYHPESAVICAECGTILNRICNTCHTSNWAGSERCHQCSTPLDVTEILSRHLPGSTSGRLSQQMAFSRQIKEEEEAASQRRMAELTAIEEARQAELRARLQKQQRQDRLLVVGGMMIAAVVLLLIAAYQVFGNW